MVAREQRDASNNASGGDQFIRRIGAEIQLCAGAGDFQADGNDGQLLQARLKSRAAQVKRDTP